MKSSISISAASSDHSPWLKWRSRNLFFSFTGNLETEIQVGFTQIFQTRDRMLGGAIVYTPYEPLYYWYWSRSWRYRANRGCAQALGTAGRNVRESSFRRCSSPRNWKIRKWKSNQYTIIQSLVLLGTALSLSSFMCCLAHSTSA